MQLAKNLFLSRDKTLSRKIEEIVLTDYLEQSFSKLEILELYLNVIEFGPAVYGIGSASEFYFGRAPAELDLAECLFLASLLPAPLRYAPMREAEQPPDGWMRNLRSLMEIERKRGLITDSELMEAQNEQVLFWHGGNRPAPRAAVRARSPLSGADNDVGDPFEEGM
jgi:membrane peptidoglycan carboxypeptidase